MFTVIVMNFAKKDNSTKQPTGGGLALQGVLKEPSSIMNPTIRIEPLANNASPHSYNYAYINKFGRYYFIKDWVWSDGLWEVQMAVDVLASFKTEIGQQNEYILRTSSSEIFTNKIIDTTYPATTDITVSSFENANPFSPATIGAGSYIVGIISGGSVSAYGAITYYAMSSTQFRALKDMLYSDTNLETMGIIEIDPTTGEITDKVTDISHDLLKALYNPYQYIVSCIWIPVALGDIPGASSAGKVSLGWWDYTTLSGSILSQSTMTVDENPITLTAHPQAQLRGEYLNYAPYTIRTISGKFGTIPLDTALFQTGDTLNIKYYVDLITGQCRAVFNKSGTGGINYLMERTFMIGVPIQIAQVSSDYLGAGVAALNGVSNAVSSMSIGSLLSDPVGSVAKSASAIASGVYNAVSTAMPQVETSGSNGSFLATGNMTKVVSKFYHVVDEDFSHRGRLLCEMRTINSLFGYILCAEGDVDIACFEEERIKINNYLVSGFFWE